MKPILDEGYFKLYIKGDVLTVALENTDDMPSINYHAMTRLFVAIQEELGKRGLTEAGWYVLYDFSAVTQYEMTAATAFANFFRWGKRNGRRKAAHIFPAARKEGEVSLVKRMVLGLVAQVAKVENDHYTAADSKDAMRWFKEMRDDEKH
ncbi:MAG: hypothetical protein IPH08_12595 [Rhodocyclaceae bacterium]|jgi:hypothetical protein|nr:hypothetical protein [Rhodocyclaceae bacterium]MBK6907850.1 hypothetical protein [Rhodocyclaceae bacterium]